MHFKHENHSHGLNKDSPFSRVKGKSFQSEGENVCRYWNVKRSQSSGSFHQPTRSKERETASPGGALLIAVQVEYLDISLDRLVTKRLIHLISS